MRVLGRSVDEPFDPLNDEDQDEWRQVKPSHLFRGNEPADRMEERLRYIIHEFDDGIVRIGVHPGEEGAYDDDPGKQVEESIEKADGILLSFSLEIAGNFP